MIEFLELLELATMIDGHRDEHGIRYKYIAKSAPHDPYHEYSSWWAFSEEPKFDDQDKVWRVDDPKKSECFALRCPNEEDYSNQLFEIESIISKFNEFESIITKLNE